ncbi:MAG TPA: UDP-3-O-(3-hydroxymyristoyl)glucosamine N-acyltransferase [Alphaproteobacteria bacterium]|nr:UDP-3-O-(3-hydroxymyristoyl)glucosamine N-acyltransferase [Alphaproteobacteria bacterium]
MTDARFFTNHGPFTLSELAQTAGGELSAGADPAMLLHDVAPLSQAGPGQISFLDNRKYLAEFEIASAGACIIAPGMARYAPPGMALILCASPYKAYALVAQKFYPPPRHPPAFAGAMVDPRARLGADVHVAPGAVIEAGAEIGAGSYIGPNAVIGAQVCIGVNAWIGALASVGCALIGDNVTLHPGVRIGQDGFGFAPDPGGFIKVPQLGRVIIQDNCDIGANTTIDRGTGSDTVIGEGTWIDNLVQIAHNVRIGRRCIIAAQTGISGSTEIGDFVMIGGQAGLTGHLKIGDGAMIAAQSGVMRDVGARERVAGSPAMPAKQHFREVASLARMAKLRGQSDE